MKFLESLPHFVKLMTDDKKLDYLVCQLKWMEENGSGDKMAKELRRAATEILQLYGVPSCEFYNDKRMLDIVMIMGRLSRTMGLKGVMHQVHARGQFKELAEFYVKWAEIYAQEKNREKFDEIWQMAINAGAKPASHIDEAFR
ncbi:hypothetical protein AB6A40_010390 [Gnathostoma spinigerum]|uniref:BUB1 N-terminal domain-containing protein n=1 Tax=Gnathostoma spinigerum TaxID=75299 RepID=A0ABD6F119_9BILA